MTKITNTAKLTAKYSLPDGSYNNTNVTSNVSATEYMTVSFLKQRLTTKTFCVPNGEFEQFLMLTNNAEHTIFDVFIVDTIENGAHFKAGTMTIDDDPYPDYDADGYFLPNEIAPGECVLIKYTIVVDDSPTASTITSVSNITYSINEVIDLSEDSNTVSVSVVNNKLKVTKTADKSAVLSGQKITFENVIENTGTITNTNIVFKDSIPTGTSFVPESVVVDGVSKPTFDPETGFQLGTLTPQEKITVSFDVIVDWLNHIATMAQNEINPL